MFYTGNLLRNQKPRPRLTLVPPEPVEQPEYKRASFQLSAVVVLICAAVFAAVGCWAVWRNFR